MQNQMMPKINLLQMPDPAARTAKYVNMMNATKQLEADQRQADIAQRTLTLREKEDAREEALQAPRLTKAEQDNIVQALGLFREAVSDIAEGDIDAAEAVRADLIARVPGYDRFVLPATEWTPAYKNQLKLTAEKEIDKTIATPVASLELGMDNSPRSVTVGGLNPQQTPVYDAPEMGAPRTPTRPAPAPTNPMARGAPAPNAAGEAPGSLGLVVASALQTGVMSKADYDKMLANVQPASRPKITNWVRENGISVADAPPLVDNQMRDTPLSYDGKTPESQFAVYRGQPMQAQTAGLAGAPEMQQTLAQTQPRTSTRLQQRTPNVSPTPGIYGVPPGQVAEISRAQRASKQELYDAEAAKIKAARDAGPAPSTPQQKRARKTEVANAYTQTQTLINKTYDPKEGAIALARKIKALSRDQKESVTGFSGYLPSIRESSREADTLIGNLKGVVTALGKDAAAASGAIGPMAVQEWKIVSDQIAKLDLENMTPRALDAQMDRIIQQVSNATNLARQVYDVQFSDDIKEYPDFKLRGGSAARTKTPVVKGGSRISPDIDKILKSRGL